MQSQNKEPKFEILHMPPENTNSVLVSFGDDAIIFDPWGRADAWEKLLESRGLRLRAIYATHGHSDHISAAPMLAEKYDVPWYMNHGDNDLIMWGNPLLDFLGCRILNLIIVGRPTSWRVNMIFSQMCKWLRLTRRGILWVV